ncbi:predicted protein [Histoplasma capsulatum G186AR]|uniref:Uncharacterized protein n=1 Tax=Ajellomyces capsulatus (strain G186AR / H82 / ATCC MYA-2454 / RMSCC 2432) TaxID=447093 RepID=C0NV99_AJECG|nr:uncharacterized protein HCBG_07079 [Histoplasma capsulatum G186AR]EEH04438.1 predicted protein [Histoplasma capsulatum G186AR]
MPSLVMVGVNRVEDDDIELSEMLAMEQPRELGPGGESAFGSDLGNRFVYSTLMAFAGMEPFHIEPETGRRILSAFAHSFDKSLLYLLKHNRIQSLLDPPPATGILTSFCLSSRLSVCQHSNTRYPPMLERVGFHAKLAREVYCASNAFALQSRAVLQVAGIPSFLSNSLTAGLLCNASGRSATYHGSLAHLY